MFQFPFGTMHQLNLDWFLQQWQQLRQDWIDEVQHIEDSMQDVYDARDAAIQAKDDAVSAKNDAQTAKNATDADALKAEGFAVGEQNGTPAGPGDPYYQSNAKYYSIESGTYRYLSEAYARGTMGGTPVDPGDAGYEDNAKYYKNAAYLDAQSASADAGFAAADALVAEGWAKGEQNGIPVSSGDPYYQDNAKYYAAQAQQDKDDADTFKDAANQAALRAEGYSSGTQNGTPVASGSPYYENNAAYFYNQSAGTSGQLAQNMIAGTEADSTSDAAYEIGQFFILSGILYKATAKIEIGDTITPGSNCTQVNIGDILYNDDINSGFSIGIYLYNMMHKKDLPLTTIQGRRISVTKNKIIQYRVSGNSIHLVSNLFGNTRIETCNIEDFPATPNDLASVNRIKNVSGTVYLKMYSIGGSGTSQTAGIALSYYMYDSDTDSYIYLSNQFLRVDASANPHGFSRIGITIPSGATHFGLFYMSYGSNPVHESIIEFDVQ